MTGLSTCRAALVKLSVLLIALSALGLSELPEKLCSPSCSSWCAGLPAPWACGARATAVMQLVVLWTAFLNAAYVGPAGDAVCCLAPTASQKRCQDSLSHRARDFLSETGSFSVGGRKELQEFLRMDLNSYESAMAVLPLSTRCKLPDGEPSVDTVGVLKDLYPSLSRKAEDPTLLLQQPPSAAAAPAAALRAPWPLLPRPGAAGLGRDGILARGASHEGGGH